MNGARSAGDDELHGHPAEAPKELSRPRRERFLGGSIADVYRRMGDPLARSCA